MPASCDIHTAHAMRKLEIESITSEASHHPIEMAFDWNLDTYWQPTSTAYQTLIIDLQSAFDIDGLALFVRNYKTDFAAESVALAYSDNGSTWYGAGTWVIMTYGSTTEPIKLFPTITESAHRWWRLIFGGTITQIIQVAQVILFNKTTIDVGNQFPEPDAQEYPVDVQNISGRMTMKRRAGRIKMQTFNRSWLLSDATDFHLLQTVIDRSLISGRPMILVENSSRYLVEIDLATFSPNKTNFAEYRPNLTFTMIPYTEDGEGY